jgi:hypothetical protein
MTPDEIVERLRPTFATLRQLFVHSGNQCAFPGCARVLVNARGQWVGEVCHIEAALAGGERFNAAMTNDQRRGGANLMLMCHEHHVETNDVQEFSVQRLREHKRDHEATFAAEPAPLTDEALEAAVKEIVESDIVDLTDRVGLRLPQTLASLNEVLAYGLSADELRENIAMLTPRLEALRKVPIDTRAVFAIALDRGADYGEDVGVPAHEVEHAAGLTAELVILHMNTLDRYGLAWLWEDEDYRTGASIMYICTKDIDGWPFWREFKTFCEAKQINIKDIVTQLRFDCLD